MAPEPDAGDRPTLSDDQLRDLAAALRQVNPLWTIADAPRVAAALGWSVAAGPDDGGMVLRTGYLPFHGFADIRFSAGAMTRIVVRLSDGTPARGTGADDYRATVFARAARLLTEVVGPPTLRRPGRAPQIRWAVPDAALWLSDSGTFVELSLLSPPFAATLDAATDAPDRDDDHGDDFRDADRDGGQDRGGRGGDVADGNAESVGGTW